MKKILFASTALAVVALAPQLSADAGTMKTENSSWRPELTISGVANFSFYNFTNKRRAEAKGNSSNSEDGGRGHGHHMSFEDAKLNFAATGKADSFFGLHGTEYGFHLGLTGERSNSKSVESASIRVRNSLGSMILGNENGVEDYHVGAHKVMGGTGGLFGNYDNVAATSTGVVKTNDLALRTKKATKASYFTPRFNPFGSGKGGFQLGVSYTPGTNHEGEGALSSQVNSLKDSNNFHSGRAFGKTSWAGNLNFSHEFENGFGMKVGVVGMTEQSKSGDSRDTDNTRQRMERGQAWSAGGELSYAGFTLGGLYNDNMKSRLKKGTIKAASGAAGTLGTIKGADAGKLYAVAGSYEIGTYKVAVGYMQSKRDNGTLTTPTAFSTFAAGSKVKMGESKRDVFSFTLDKAMAPGWKVYGEFNHFRDKNTKNVVAVQEQYRSLGNSNDSKGRLNNSGHVVIVGTKVKF